MDVTPGSVQGPIAGAGQALDRRAELSEFLRTRRARLKPEDVGLPDFGRHRRVPGLRREELAQLAGVSVAYYTRLEQGNGRNVSAEVLDAIARALRLSDAEHAHLTHLAKPKAHKKKPSARSQQVRSSLRQLLDTFDGVPAYVVGRRAEVLAWNRMAAAVFGDWSRLPQQERNWARMVFLQPEYHDLFVDWEQKAIDIVCQLRYEAGCYPRSAAVGARRGAVGEERGVPAAVGDARRQGEEPRTQAAETPAGGRSRVAVRVVPTAERR